MALSILHRITGCALSVGLLLFVYWLAGVAAGPEAYAQTQQVLQHPFMRVVLIGLSFAFFYHLCNGLRHLTWDAGRGFDKKVARASGWFAFIAALSLTVGFWVLVGTRGAA